MKPRALPSPRAHRRGRGVSRLGLVASAAVFLALIGLRPLPGRAADDEARQVTLFGVIASPSDQAVDPKLARVEGQLRKLLPKHGFKLLDAQSKRLTTGQSVGCDLASGYTATATLTQTSDDNGKVQIRCNFLKKDAVQLETLVTTPPNQLFFCEKTLPDGTRFLVGVGAR